MSFPTGVIQPGKRVSGYVFTPLDEAVKRIDVRLLGRSRSLDFPFTVEVPGLVLPHRPAQAPAACKIEELDEAAFKVWLQRQPRCTSNARGTIRAILSTWLSWVTAKGSRSALALGTRPSRSPCTAWKTAKAFLLESHYRYSPVSPLYLGERGRISRCNAPARASISASTCAYGPPAFALTDSRCGSARSAAISACASR